MPVFAHHAHVFPEAMNASGTIDRLLGLMDECGIDSAVCFAPFPHQVQGTGIDANPWLAGELASRPRLRGFGTLDFRRADIADQVRRSADLGFRGLKLHPNAQEFDVLSAQCLAACAAAEELKLFVSFHTGVHYYRLRSYSLTKFDEIAHRYPKLRFSLEHVGGYHFFNEALAVMFNNFPPPWVKGERCHIFAGLASVFTQHQNRFWYLRPDQIMEIAHQTSIDQLIFGLDFPYNLERETKIGLETIAALPLTEAQKGQVLGGNLARELGVVF